MSTRKMTANVELVTLLSEALSQPKINQLLTGGTKSGETLISGADHIKNATNLFNKPQAWNIPKTHPF